jgi:ABC-type sugar transport system permease subunit
VAYVQRQLAQAYKYRMAYLFLTPAFALMAAFILYPLVRGMYLSLFEWNGIFPPEYVGLLNFEYLLEDTTFFKALRNNIQYSIFTTLGTTVLGFSLAYAIERRVRGWRIFKVAYFIPVMMSGTVVGLLWGLMYDPTFGPINRFLALFGIPGPEWLGDPDTAMWAVIAVTIWQYTGFSMIIFLAALEAIPVDIQEAATLDGISHLQRVFLIQLPLVRSVFAVWTMLQIIFSFKVFDLVFAMTGGGPGEATVVLGVHLYNTAFRFTQFGYGSALAVAMAAIIILLTIVYMLLVNIDPIEY